MDDLFITSIEEKPVRSFYVNAGIYVIDPALLCLIPRGQTFDMPQLIDKAIMRDHEVTAFPIHEYWLDIGQHDTFELAKRSW